MTNRRRVLHFFSTVLMTAFLAVQFISLLWGLPVNADSTTDLTDLASVSVTQVKTDSAHGSIDLIANPDTEVTYGDTIEVTLSWEIPDGVTFSSSDSFTYTLPGNVIFNSASGNLVDGNRNLGTYSISSNVITINYTDDGFCTSEEVDRVGSLTFEGRITDDGNGGQTQGTVDLLFPIDNTVSISMLPPSSTSEVDVAKRFETADTTDHIYNCIITITSTGSNTNVTLADEMWPGMYLYSAPCFYESDMSTTRTGVTDSTARPSSSNRHVNAVIDHMSDGEVVYVVYQVQVNPAMYDWDTAQAHVGNLSNYYPYTYDGNVPNRADVYSDEDTSVDTAWADIRTLRATFGKWSDPTNNDFEHGLIGWQIALYSINGYGYSNGYIVDTLPEGNSLNESSVVVTNAAGNVIPNAVSIRTETDDATGDITVWFVFSSDLISYLNASESSEAWISYQTKVNSQDPDTVRYYNAAEIFYDGISRSSTGSDVDYTKPDELDKTVYYTPATAPFARYQIEVNPAALDLSPASSELTLVDTMSSSYDLAVSSVRINGQVPADGVFTYDQATRTMTFNLADNTAYVITYDAAVNLVPGSTLDTSNSGNSATLYASQTVISSVESTLSCDVYQSAGSSSSTLLGRINVIKHAEGDTTETLAGASFELSTMYNTNGTVTGASTVSATTEANGTIAFNNITRGRIYMLTETAAPAGYRLDSTPSFYAFETASSSLPSTVVYEGTTYTLNIISANKISTDVYVANASTTQSTPPNPVTPNNPVTPVTPNNPTNPTTPTTPENPSTPTTPTTPAAPVVPDPSETPVTTPAVDQPSEQPATPSESYTEQPAPVTSVAGTARVQEEVDPVVSVNANDPTVASTGESEYVLVIAILLIIAAAATASVAILLRKH